MSTISSGLGTLGSNTSSSLGTISSSTGLISGIPIQDTVNKLISLEAAPRDRLTKANQTLQTQQTAYASLTASLLGLEVTTNGLATTSLYSAQTLTSSAPTLITATSTGSVAAGTYQYTPIRQAQAQQYSSSKFTSNTAAVGPGSLTIRYGGFVDNSLSLDVLNSGQGVPSGQIRITDRSGASTLVDLSTARTVDDVLQAINTNSTVRVTAVADGNSFKLVDNTGLTTSNLRVDEVNGGTTAAALGLAGINTATNTAQGTSVIRLFNELPLAQTNQGLGVAFDNALADLNVTFRDGTSTSVDFHQLPTAGTLAHGTTQAANGLDASLTLSAAKGGNAYAGVAVVFQNDPSVTEGNETVNYDATNKVLRFSISAGHTTANDVISALKRDTTAGALFTAAAASGGSGNGVVSVSDTTITTGPPSTAVTSALSANAKLLFTAAHPGSAYDGVAVKFVANASVQEGHETVAYDASGKQLVFQIADGSTTANDVIAALNNDPTANQIFTAAAAPGSNGTGLVSTSDTATTAGGTLVEPTSGTNETTLGDILKTLNAAAPGKLNATISADGQHIQLTDLTTDNGGTFAVTDLNHSRSAEDLGLSTTAQGATLTGGLLIGGLKTTLLRGLNGGQGLGTLATLALTDRSGATATVDLSGAQTLDNVIDTINAAGLGITASVNSARNGIQLLDNTGSTASNLVVANADSTNTADKLQIASNSAGTAVNSGSLNLQTLSTNSALSGLNGGKGVQQSFFTIVDSSGATSRVNIGSAQTTLGSVIDEINSLGIGVQASLNATGDGILIQDTAHGSGNLKITEGSSTTAADLHLLGAVSTTTVGGQPTQSINGSTATTITLSATDTLQDLITKINASTSGAQAALFSDGSTVKPYSLQVFSQVAGQAGALQIDTSQLGFSLNQTVAAQDALIRVNGQGAAGTLVSSSTNQFKNVLAGATLTVNGSSATPVSITVAASNTKLTATVQALVDGYNRIQTALKQDTTYDPTTNTGGPLQGDAALLSTERQLADLITNQSGTGSIRSLADLGVTIAQDGTAQFDSSVLQSKFDSDPQSVQSFLSASTTGISSRFKAVLEQLAGTNGSVLSSRNDAITSQIKDNQNRIAVFNNILSSEQSRLLAAFYAQETVIAKLQASLSTINALAPLTPITGVSSIVGGTGA